MRLTVAAHILAGGLGIVSGFVALWVVKGGPVHRRSGMLFVYAMVFMALMGSAMAAVRRIAPLGNVPAGLMTAYFVITGLTTVRPPSERWRRLDIALLAVALAVSGADLVFGFLALAAPNGRLQGMPAFPFFLFGVVGLLASAGDVRMIRAGGARALRGVQRLARHLWRMTFALAIAALSFFLGQAKVIPKPIRVMPLLAVPPLMVIVALAYWMWRVRFRRNLRGIVLGAGRAERREARRVIEPPRTQRGAEGRRGLRVPETVIAERLEGGSSSG